MIKIELMHATVMFLHVVQNNVTTSFNHMLLDIFYCLAVALRRTDMIFNDMRVCFKVYIPTRVGIA